jgi:hypothetical protein
MASASASFMYKTENGLDTFSTRKSVLAALVQAKVGNASAKQELTSREASGVAIGCYRVDIVIGLSLHIPASMYKIFG